MKKIVIVFVIVFVIVLGIAVLAGLVGFKAGTEMTRAKIIEELEVDGVDEVDKGIITLKIDGQYYDYEYEYVEGFKTLQERINNGENVKEELLWN